MTAMPPAKILHLITSLERGGAQTNLAMLVRSMDRARFAPLVVSLIEDGAVAAELAQAGIPVQGLGMRRGMPSVAALLRLRRIIAAERPDLVQSWLYHADLLGLAATAFSGPPLAWNLRNSEIAQAKLVRRLLAHLSSWPAAVLVNSAAGQRFHQAIGYRPKRWEIVPNGFDVALFRPDAALRSRERRRLGIAAAQPVIGMVARVDPMKDHATFLAAAEGVAAARGDAAFLLVGAGTERLTLPASLAGRVHALGERANLQEILPALDLMVLASLGEGFPNVIGEAMACGVPCVASDVGDAAAIIADTGTVVPRRDPVALAGAILALLDRGPAELGRLGEAARARVVANYSIEAAVARYETIYAELVSSRPTAPA
jgi:glycosyltransferase involved in cell wall biosynthesis